MAKNNRQRARWVGLGRVQSFMLILGRVGSGWVTSLVGRVGSVKKTGPTRNSDSTSCTTARSR